MITMTFNEALNIQRAQLVYYRQSIGRKGVKSIMSRTKYPVDLQPDVPMPVRIINELVPRGADFEALLFHRPSEYCPVKHALHDAIRRGLF